MEAKYERVVATSLRGLGSMMSILGKDRNDEADEQYRTLLDRPKVWKYGKHKVGAVRNEKFAVIRIFEIFSLSLFQIRSAFYAMIATVCQHLSPEILSSYSSNICSVALAGVGELERSVCLTAWDAILQALNSIEVSCCASLFGVVDIRCSACRIAGVTSIFARRFCRVFGVY